MSLWKRVKPAAEWGLFFGVVSWLLATGVTNKMTEPNVWSIVLSRTLAGALLGYLKWESSKWIRGLVIGAAVNLPVSLWAIGWTDFNFSTAIGFIWIPGIVCGIATELLFKRYLAREAKAVEDENEGIETA